MTPSELKQKIAEYSERTGESLLESTVAIADELEIDLEVIAQHVTGSLKEMMQIECEADGMLKKESNHSHAFD